MTTASIYAPAIAGRGLAGQCPAPDSAKTPAARVRVIRVADQGGPSLGLSSHERVGGGGCLP